MNTPVRPHRVLIVDDEPGHRMMCRLALEQDGGFECVGEAFNGRRAIERLVDCDPDLVVLDLRMPTMDGLEALPHLRYLAPRARLVVWSNESELEFDIARERGAHASVSKLAPLRVLVATLHRAMSRSAEDDVVRTDRHAGDVHAGRVADGGGDRWR